MAISKDLLLAILSMDAYNRGYDPGISGLGGSASSLGDGLGNAVVTNENRSDEAKAADFYAVAYDTEYGKIIAYRGTDNLPGEIFAVDYPIAFNADFDEAEVHLAVQFYQAVAGSSNSSNLTLTGHSLGGGLAGFVGGVYDQEAVGFASIGFFPAMQNFQKLVDRYQEIKADPLLYATDIISLPGMGLFFTAPLAEEQLAAMGISLTDVLPPISAHLAGTYTGFHARIRGQVACFMI